MIGTGHIDPIPFDRVDWQNTGPLIAESFVLGVGSMDVRDQLVVPGEFPPDLMAQAIERMPLGAITLGALRRFVGLGCGSAGWLTGPRHQDAERELEEAAEHTVERVCRRWVVDAEERGATARLAQEVRSRLRAFVRASELVTFDGNVRRYSAKAEHILAHPDARGLDVLLAELLEGLGPSGKEHAEYSRARANMAPAWPWIAAADTPTSIDLPWLRAISKAVWLDVVEPELERKKRNPPALAYRIHEDVARIHSRAFMLEERSGQRALVYDHADPIAVVPPSLAESAVLELVERGVGLLGSVASHRVLRWEVVNGYHRAMAGEPDARVLRFNGGWAPFAESLGMKSKRAPEDLRAIVYAQAAVRMALPSGDTGNLVALREQTARGRQRGAIEITLGTMLLPHYVHEIGEHLSGRAAREESRLVPVVAALPPLVGRANDHGAQVTFSMLLVRELRVHARELVTDGGVLLTPERLIELARQAGLPVPLVASVMDRLIRDGDDAPAFLERTSAGRYTLGHAHEPERVFLEESGRREVAGAEGGRRSVLARARKRARLKSGGE